MPDIPNRDKLESEYTRALARLLKKYGGNLLEKMGDPPSFNNVPPEFWDDEARALLEVMRPFGSKVYLDAARMMIAEGLDIGIEWTLVNEAAADWAAQNTNKWIMKMVDDDRNAVRRGVERYYREGLTRGELETQLLRNFTPERASRIAVTEITRAASEGEQQIARELAKQGIIMTPVWQTNNDEIVRKCPICWPRHGKEIKDGVFPPGHPNCLPGNSLVLPVGGVFAGSERWYKGDVITIDTLEYQLTVTPNHPILTSIGWVAAGKIKQGDNVFCCDVGEWESLLVNVDNQYGKAFIKDIFSSLDINGFRVPTSAPDFHGDGGQSKVAVIRPNSEVVDNVVSHQGEPFAKFKLACGHVVIQVPLTGFGALAGFGKRNLAPSTGVMGGGDLGGSLGGGHPLPLDSLGLGLASRLDTRLNQALSERPSIDSQFFGQAVLGLPFDVALQEVIKIRNDYFIGHVYNLQTESGLFVADGIITHNCRCWHNWELPK